MNNYFDDNPRGKSRGGSNDYFRENRRPVQVTGRGNVRGSSRGGGRGSSRGGKAPVPLLIAIDVLVAGLIFLLFFCTQFLYSGGSEEDGAPSPSEVGIASVSPTDTQSSPLVSPTDGASAPVITPSASIDPNDWRAKFADKFSQDGKVHQQSTEINWTYQSPNINVSTTKNTDNGVVYFVTEIYIADIKYFKTWYTDNWDSRLFTVNALEQAGGVVGINGDFYAQNGLLTIRNGQYVGYNSKSICDELVMYTDGTMQTFAAADFDYESVKAQASDKVYQVWGFGPMLLNNGEPMTRFNSTVANNPKNSRTAIGYFEPGHYCFVTVDGRQPGYSDPGYTCTQLSNLMYSLGCKVAFNLDGGGSAQLAFMGNEINHACSDKRKNYDILYITDQG